jgi:opacity protein-like surface antigen
MPDGSKVTAFGVDALLGGAPGVVGFKPYFVIGAASYKVKNDDTKFEETDFGFSGGLGVMLGLTPKFDVDVRGKAVVIPMEDGGSKKAISVIAGVAINL